MQNFLTSAESKAFVKAAEAVGFEHQGSLGPTKGEAYRDNDRISVTDRSLNVFLFSPLNLLLRKVKFYSASHGHLIRP